MDYDLDRELASYREDCPDDDGWEEWYAEMVAPHERDSLPSDFGLCPDGLHRAGECDCGTCGGESEVPF